MLSSEWLSSEHPGLLQSFAPDFVQEHDLSNGTVRFYSRLCKDNESTKHPEGPKPDAPAAAWCRACDAALMPVTPVCRFIAGRVHGGRRHVWDVSGLHIRMALPVGKGVLKGEFHAGP